MHVITDSVPRTHRQMTAAQLLQLGKRQVVYLKARMRDADLVFMLYGAEGALLMKFDSVEEAVETVAANGLNFATVH